MAVFKRGKFYWFNFNFNGQRVQKTTKQCDKDAAKDIEAAYRTALAKGEVGIKDKKAERWKVSELLDRRLADLRERGKDSDGNRSLNKHVKEDFGARWADELTDDDLNAYFKERRAEGYAVATVMNHIDELRQAYIDAKLTPPKMRELSVEEKDNVRTGFFSKAEFEAVCERMPEDLRDFCRFGHITGWRFGSIAKLRWDDVEDGEINLPGRFTKNKKPLKMPLFGELAELVARREGKKVVKTPAGAQLCDLVFHRRGKPVHQSWFRLVWVEACLAAGQGRMFCPKCGQEGVAVRGACSHCRRPMKYEGRLFHDLRRSAARDMIRAGVAQTIAMKITGHKTATMFQRYNIADTDDLREALSRTALYREAGQQKVRSIAAARR